MNSRRLIIMLTCLYSLLQLALVMYWASLSAAGESPVGMPLSIVVIAASITVNIVVVRYILRSLQHMRVTYADGIDSQLRRYLEAYRNEAAANERLIREIALEIDEELVRAGMALESGDSNEVGRRLRTGLDLASTIRAQDCGHVAVAAVLGAKSRQCNEAGVLLSTQVSLPEELPLPEIEIASVFFNFIDNALNECKALRSEKASVVPEIRVYACIQAQQFFVQVTNPCRPQSVVRQEASQSRSPQSPHGLGTGVVTDIAKRHGGIVDFAERKGVFTAAAMIPLPKA